MISISIQVRSILAWMTYMSHYEKGSTHDID